MTPRNITRGGLALATAIVAAACGETAGLDAIEDLALAKVDFPAAFQFASGTAQQRYPALRLSHVEPAVRASIAAGIRREPTRRNVHAEVGSGDHGRRCYPAPGPFYPVQSAE